jgi:Fe-S cluster assembly protein SufD
MPTSETFAAVVLPTPQEEVWRYSRIDELDLSKYTPAAAAGSAVDTAFAETVGERSGIAQTSNGHLVAIDLDESLVAKGVTLAAVESAALARPEVDDVFVGLNAESAPAPLVLDVPAGVVVEHSIVITHWVDADGVAVFPRLLVRAGEQSQVTVVEHFASGDVDALVMPVTEIEAGPAANVRYLGVQELGARAWQLAYASSRAGRDAFVETTAVALGGDYARLRTDARVVGQGATSNLLAVYFGTGSQMHDFRTMQDHAAPRTTSDLLFKGAVSDEASSVYTGLIRVRPGAHGTNAFQTNRNLVLSEGAHAESVPNLEIEENDVRCSHASAIGPVDEEQRYYLESRGVPTPIAERLIVFGFFDEIFERAAVPSLRTALRDAVAAKLDATGTS